MFKLKVIRNQEGSYLIYLMDMDEKVIAHACGRFSLNEAAAQLGMSSRFVRALESKVTDEDELIV